MQFAHPRRATLWCVAQSAVEVEGGANGYLYAVCEVWLQAIHKDFLLGCAKGYPNDVGTVLLYHLGDAGIVELVNGAEGKLLESHSCYVGVLIGKILLQSIEHILLCAQEYHSVFAGTDDVDEDVAAAVVCAVVSVNPLNELWHPTAVADGEDAVIDYLAVACVVVHHCEDVAVGNANVAGFSARDVFVNSLVHLRSVKLVSYVKVLLHNAVALFVEKPKYP